MSDDPLMVEVKKSAARVSVSSDEEVVVTQAPAKKKIPSDREWLDNLDQESLNVLKKNTKSPREVEDLSLKCTSCYQQINHLLPGMVHRHPILNVPTCKSCKKFYFDGEWTRDEDGFFEYCRWCANGGELLICSSDKCKSVFCKKCIKRNLGRKVLADIQENDDWNCLVCDPKPLMSTHQAVYYSLCKYWEVEKARQNRLEDSRRKREKITCQSKGAISDLLSDYSDVNFISKDYVEGQQRKWKLKSAAVANETDRAKLSFKFAQNLLKIIAINRTNLDTLEKKVKEKLAEELPDLDLGEIERAAAALNSPDQLKKEGGKVDSNSADGHDEEESDGREELNTCNEDSDCHESMIVSDVITVESAPTSRNSKECGVKVSGKGRKQKIGSSEEDEGNDSEKENNNRARCNEKGSLFPNDQPTDGRNENDCTTTTTKTAAHLTFDSGDEDGGGSLFEEGASEKEHSSSGVELNKSDKEMAKESVLRDISSDEDMKSEDGEIKLDEAKKVKAEVLTSSSDDEENGEQIRDKIDANAKKTKIDVLTPSSDEDTLEHIRRLEKELEDGSVSDRDMFEDEKSSSETPSVKQVQLELCMENDEDEEDESGEKSKSVDLNRDGPLTASPALKGLNTDVAKEEELENLFSSPSPEKNESIPKASKLSKKHPTSGNKVRKDGSESDCSSDSEKKKSKDKKSVDSAAKGIISKSPNKHCIDEDEEMEEQDQLETEDPNEDGASATSGKLSDQRAEIELVSEDIPERNSSSSSQDEADPIPKASTTVLVKKNLFTGDQVSKEGSEDDNSSDLGKKKKREENKEIVSNSPRKSTGKSLSTSKPSKPTTNQNNSRSDSENSDHLGLGSDSGENEKKIRKKQLKKAKHAEDNEDKKNTVSENTSGKEKKKLTSTERLKRRYNYLIRKIDRSSDRKLNSVAQVEIRAISDKIFKELGKYGEVYVKEFPELLELCKKRKKSNKDFFDAEIDKLCNLKNLERISKPSDTSDSNNKSNSDQSQTEKSPLKKIRETKGHAKKKKNEKTRISSEEEGQANDSMKASDSGEDSDPNADEVLKKRKLELPVKQNELSKKAVLDISDDDDDVNDGKDAASDSSSSENARKLNDGKSKKKQKNSAKQNDNEKGDGTQQQSKKKKETDPGFLRMKLSETDSSEAEEKAQERGRKKDEERKKQREGGGDESGSSDDFTQKRDNNGSGGRKKKNPLGSDSEEDSKSSSEEEEEDEKSSEEEDSDIEDIKKKRKRRKKAPSSSDDDSEDEPRPKKKRRRIKKNSSSDEDGEDKEKDSGEEDGDSPSKSHRKDIRKIMKDKKLSSSTKSAANEERDRRKRMEEKQKLYNQLFETKETKKDESKVLKELPLDFDEKTKEVLVEVDKKIVKKLKPHQGGGIKFMWDAVFESKEKVEKDECPGGAILAHCMGLGKTLQTVSLIHTAHTNFEAQVSKVLVLCPVNTVKNWEDEFGKWLKGDLEIDVYEMSGEKDNWGRCDRLSCWMREGGVMIMGYDMFRNLSADTKKFKKKQRETFQQALVDPGPDLVVCDEGHVLKNLKSALNIAMNKIKTKRRVILTGTPIQNNLSEYFAMVNFVKPSLLGTYGEFKNRFVNPIQNGQHSDSTDRDVRIMQKRSFVLADLLKGCMQRLDYTVLVPYLQPKYEYVLCICLTEFQKKLYSFYLENFARAGQIGVDGKLEGGKKGGLFYDVQTLSQVWNHPYILLMAKNRRDQKMMDKELDDEEDDAGSLKDFIDDADEESAKSTSSSDDGEEENSDDIECLEGGGDKKVKKTRSNAKDNKLVGGLDEAKKEQLANEKLWWNQFLEKDQVLETLENGSKMVLLMDILKECELVGDKVLVFSQSLLSLDLIEEFLAICDAKNRAKDREDDSLCYFGSWAHGKDYFRMDGSTPPESRKRWCNYFNKKTNHKMRLFLISTKAGGLGINLVAANRVIIFDASWNPAHDVQSIFRVYRFGQEKPVYIYRFLAKGTMEEKIYDRQVSKQSLSARVVDEHQIERHFSMNELAELYEFNDEPMSARPIPSVPKDRLLAELIKKHGDLIWKFHDHDSLLENQVDENLSEEDRKAAWEEFENEKKGFVNFGNAQLQNQVIQNINPQDIQEQYRRQYPQLTDEQVVQATRAYIMQIQSGLHRKPAYDKSHYQQEMARAREREKALYPGMFRHRGQAPGGSNTMMGGAGPSTSGPSAQWQAQVMAQQRQYQKQQQQQQQQQQIAMLRQQMYAAQMLQQQQQQKKTGRAAAAAEDDGEVVVLDGSPETSEIVLDGSPTYQEPAVVAPTPPRQRRGRPRLDPDDDDIISTSRNMTRTPTTAGSAEAARILALHQRKAGNKEQ